MKNFTPLPQTKKGFTLIELMVAMVIAVIIMGMLVGITNVAMGAWQRGRAEVRASRQAKAMLEAIAKDFESLVVRSGNNYQWLHAETEGTMPGTSSDRSSNAAEIIFFSAATDRYRGGAGTAADKGGDVCTVSYKLAYQDPVEGRDNENSTFVFYRQLVDPKPTFDSILATTDLRTAFRGTSGSNEFETRSTASQTENAKFNFVCENIYQFSITFRVDVTKLVGSKTEITPVRITLLDDPSSRKFHVYGDRIVTDASVQGISVTPDELKAGRLTAVEISTTVLSDTGMNQLKTRKFKDAKDKAKFLLQNSYEFSKIIDVPGL